jgi:hypothetical protein
MNNAVLPCMQSMQACMPKHSACPNSIWVGLGMLH